MKQCPACNKTFEDSMKFCQTDGTPLMTAAEDVTPPQPPTTPNDPFKTVVAGLQSTREDDILQLPVEHDPMKTMVVSNIKKEIPPPMQSPAVSQPLNPPVFSEPLISPPNFGDSTPATPVKPFEEPATMIVPPDLPNFDATFTSMPLPSDSPFGSSPNKPSNSPFDQPMTNPFTTPNSLPIDSSSTNYTPPSFKEPEPMFTGQNEPFGNPFGQPNNQMEQSAWTPPPAPDQNWANQGVGQNTPFQTPPISGGQGQNQTLAIISLVTGILSICCYIGWITGPVALITGYLHRKKVKENPAEFGGDGLALAGMITGGILSGLWLLIIVFYVLIFGLAALSSQF
jgi:Domain of unknown function (DUF4190)